MKGERERHLAALAFVLDGRVELTEEAHLALVAEPHDVAGGKPLRRPHKGAPARAVETPVQRRFDGGLGVTAADAAALQPRRNHLGVIDDQRVAGLQQVRQIAHTAIIEFRLLARPHDQQPRRIARNNRPQRNPLWREFEIEQIRAHRAVIAHNRGR